jgi:hypothetical protein
MNIQEKRRLFLERFGAAVREQSVAELPSWFSPPWPEDTAIASWLDVSKKRCMRVDEAGADDLDLDFFFESAGSDDELMELFVRLRDAHEHADIVLEAYRLWLLEGARAERVESFLRDARRGHV